MHTSSPSTTTPSETHEFIFPPWIREAGHPDWCVRDNHCDEAEDPDTLPIHRSPVTVINDDGSFPVNARLEKRPVSMGLTYSVDISNEVDVPIQYARALGEYLIAAADRYAPQ